MILFGGIHFHLNVMHSYWTSGKHLHKVTYFDIQRVSQNFANTNRSAGVTTSRIGEISFRDISIHSTYLKVFNANFRKLPGDDNLQKKQKNSTLNSIIIKLGGQSVTASVDGSEIERESFRNRANKKSEVKNFTSLMSCKLFCHRCF